MAKTLQTLITEATNICDEDFDNAQWVEWLNNGLDDIAPILYIDDKVTIAIVDGGFPIPTDHIATLRIDGVNKNLKMLDYTDDTSVGYRVVEGNFVLQNDTATSIELWYYKSPPYFDTSSISSPIDTRVVPTTRALVFYACAMGMLREDEPERYDLYITQYNNAKGVINQRNINKRAGRAGQWGVVR